MDNNSERSLFSRLSCACAAFSFAIRATICMGNSWHYIRNNWSIETRRTKTLGYNRINSMSTKTYCNIIFIKIFYIGLLKEKIYD